MSIFSNYKSDGLEKAQDRVGGFSLLDSDIYQMTIKAFYATESKSGATGAVLIGTLDNGREYRETFWVSDKEKKNYWVGKDGKHNPLPGFTLANDVCLVGCEKPLCEVDMEDKVIAIYDPEAKKEVPTSVPVVTALIGKKIAVAIGLERHNKTEKQGDKYVETSEEVERNAIHKVFHPELKVTVVEAEEGKEATFWDKWLNQWKGKKFDRRKNKGGEAKEGRPQKTESASAPKKSLFGNK